jgi:hypothetical protein
MDAPGMAGMVSESRAIEHAAMCQAIAAWSIEGILDGPSPACAMFAEQLDTLDGVAKECGLAAARLREVSTTLAGEILSG